MHARRRGPPLGGCRPDPAGEQSPEAEQCESSARLGDLLVSPQSTPGRAAGRHEDAVRLARALGQLPEAQHRALVVRHRRGLSLVEVGPELDRTPAAVAGLLERGLRQLRFLMGEGQGDEGRSA
jgi:DNA-directed RNA polymerase specialized sigma24 family protein